ncbi:MAG: ATP-binding protein [Pseudomonadota bacterium]
MTVRSALIATIIALLTVTVTTILLSSYITTKQVLRGHIQEIISYVAAQTVDETTDFLLPAQAAADLTRRLTDNELVSHGDMASVELQFYEQLILFPQFAGIFLGWDNGEFVFVKRDDAVIDDGFRTKIIAGQGPDRRTELIWRDADFKEIKREIDQQDTYDPRQRPWFQKAMDRRALVWTDPYIFYTSRNPGITTAAPVSEDGGRLTGVVGVDIEIGAISQFLSELRIGKEGKAMIISRTGDIIAYPDKSAIVRQSATDLRALRFAKVHELADPVASALFDTLGSGLEDLPRRDSLFHSFSAEGEAHHSIIVPLPNSIWPWLIAIHMPEDDYLGAIKKNQIVNIGLAIVIGVAAIAAGLFLARQISQPMASLRDQAMRITRGDLNTETPLRSPFKEVRATQSAFDQMTGGLKDQKSQNHALTKQLHVAKSDLEQSVERRTQELRAEISERRQAELRAERANSAKTRFLANMSHELRTPLNAIVGFSEIIKTQAFGAISNQRYVSYGTDIYDAGNHLRALIEDMIDLALIEGEKLPLNEEFIDPCGAARNSIRMVEAMADKKEISLSLEAAAPDVLLKADAVRIRQILINLLTNAIKYTPNGGAVTVRVSSVDDGGIKLEVSDNGVGLSQEHNELTQSLYAMRDRRSRNGEESHGLGLPLTAKLVEAHGGTFSLTSSHSRGTTAVAHFPPHRVIHQSEESLQTTQEPFVA